MLQGNRVEVDQEAELVTRELQVGEHLCVVNFGEFINGFQFEDDATFYENIQPISCIDLDTSKMHGQGLLTLNGQSTMSQFMDKTGFIGAFQQSRTEFPMH